MQSSAENDALRGDWARRRLRCLSCRAALRVVVGRGRVAAGLGAEMHAREDMVTGGAEPKPGPAKLISIRVDIYTSVGGRGAAQSVGF